jgi:flagellar motor component MotA
MVTTPLKTLIRAAKYLGTVFFRKIRGAAAGDRGDHLLRHQGAQEQHHFARSDLETIADPFLRKAISLSVDGTDLQELRKMMELDLDLQQRSGESVAKVYECAGGYAPTIGIIGAVLG